MIEDALFSYLNSVAGVAALIARRIYPVDVPPEPQLPGAKWPLVRSVRRGGPRSRTIGGPTGMATAMMDLEAYGKTYRSAKAVSNELRLALDGYDLSRGPMGTEAVEVHSVVLRDEEDDYDYELLKYIVRTPVEIWYSEATA